MTAEEKAEAYVLREDVETMKYSECYGERVFFEKEVKKAYIDGLAEGKKENEELKNKNFVVTQSYNNALAENRGLKDIINELKKENKQLQTRSHIVPEHYLTEALDKCHELERKNAAQNEIIHELRKPPLYDGYSLQLENAELKEQNKMKNLYKEGIPEDKDRLCIFFDGEYYIDTFNNLSSSEQKRLIKWCYLPKITER